jgi:hypothetical protein
MTDTARLRLTRHEMMHIVANGEFRHEHDGQECDCCGVELLNGTIAVSIYIGGDSTSVDICATCIQTMFRKRATPVDLSRFRQLYYPLENHIGVQTAGAYVAVQKVNRCPTAYPFVVVALFLDAESYIYYYFLFIYYYFLFIYFPFSYARFTCPAVSVCVKPFECVHVSVLRRPVHCPLCHAVSVCV